MVGKTIRFFFGFKQASHYSCSNCWYFCHYFAEGRLEELKDRKRQVVSCS